MVDREVLPGTWAIRISIYSKKAIVAQVFYFVASRPLQYLSFISGYVSDAEKCSGEMRQDIFNGSLIDFCSQELGLGSIWSEDSGGVDC